MSCGVVCDAHFLRVLVFGGVVVSLVGVVCSWSCGSIFRVLGSVLSGLVVVLGGLGSLGRVGVVFGLWSFKGLLWVFGWVVWCWVVLWSFLGSWGVGGVVVCLWVLVCVCVGGLGWWCFGVLGVLVVLGVRKTLNG